MCERRSAGVRSMFREFDLRHLAFATAVIGGLIAVLRVVVGAWFVDLQPKYFVASSFAIIAGILGILFSNDRSGVIGALIGVATLAACLA